MILKNTEKRLEIKSHTRCGGKTESDSRTFDAAVAEKDGARYIVYTDGGESCTVKLLPRRALIIRGKNRLEIRENAVCRGIYFGIDYKTENARVILRPGGAELKYLLSLGGVQTQNRVILKIEEK